MDHLTLVVIAANTTTLIAASIVSYLAGRAFERSGSRALRWLTVGFGLVAVGALIGGTLHQFGGVSLISAVAAQSVFLAAGFVALVYSLSLPHSAETTRLPSTRSE